MVAVHGPVDAASQRVFYRRLYRHEAAKRRSSYPSREQLRHMYSGRQTFIALLFRNPQRFLKVPDLTISKSELDSIVEVRCESISLGGATVSPDA